MGFFSDLKDDLSQAVNEMMPEEEGIDAALARMYLEQYPYPEIFEVAECEYDKKGRIIKYIMSDFRSEKYSPDGNLRRFEYEEYHYDHQGLCEKEYFQVFVHLKRKANIFIPEEFFSPELEDCNSYEWYNDWYKKLIKLGFTVFRTHTFFTHDEEGYICNINGKLLYEHTFFGKKKKRV